MAVITRTGSWPDVIQTPNGWAFVYADDADVIVEENGVEIWRWTVTGTTGFPRSLRAAVAPDGTVKVICACEVAGNQDFAFLIESTGQTNLGVELDQQNGVMLTYESGEFVAYMCDSTSTYIRQPIGGVAVQFPMGFETVQGINDVVDGVITFNSTATQPIYEVVFADVVFQLPNTRAGVTVGQAKGEPVTPEGIIAWNGQQVSTVIPVQGFNPHVAQILAGPDAGNYVFTARILGGGDQNAAYVVLPVKAFGAYDGTSILATIPPVSHPVEENAAHARPGSAPGAPVGLVAGSTRMTLPWQGWAQAVRKALANAGVLIAGLQQAIGEAVGFGRIAVEGQSTVLADQANDTLELTSEDGSIGITTSPVDKRIDLSVADPGNLDAEYLVAAADPSLPNARVVEDTDTVKWDFTVPGVAKANATGGAYVPVSTGEEPLVIMSNGAGEVLLTPYTPDSV